MKQSRRTTRWKESENDQYAQTRTSYIHTHTRACITDRQRAITVNTYTRIHAHNGTAEKEIGPFVCAKRCESVKESKREHNKLVSAWWDNNEGKTNIVHPLFHGLQTRTSIRRALQKQPSNNNSSSSSDSKKWLKSEKCLCVLFVCAYSRCCVSLLSLNFYSFLFCTLISRR